MNEIINIIPYFIAIFIGNTLYDLCFAEIIKVKLKWNIKTFFIILSSTILVYCNNLYDNMILKTILNFVIFCTNYKILFKENLKKTIVTYIIIYVLTIIFEVIYSNVIISLKILEISARNLTYARAILSVSMAISSYLTLKIGIVKKILERLLNLIENIITASSFLYLLLVTIIVIGILNVYNYEQSGSFIVILIVVALFAILFTIIIKLKAEEEYLKNSNKKLIEYNEKYGQFLDEYKIYKHNIKNKLAGMKTFGNKKINSLIDDLLEEETTFSIKSNNLYNIPNGIKGIVAEKLYGADLNILVENKLEKDLFLKLSAKKFNAITEAIGICLDNAIEACKDTEEPIILIDIYEDAENLFVKIGNNFSNNIDIDKLGEKYYSTKNRGSGFGLFSIIQNKVIKEKVSIINNIFYIELQIKKHD